MLQLFTISRDKSRIIFLFRFELKKCSKLSTFFLSITSQTRRIAPKRAAKHVRRTLNAAGTDHSVISSLIKVPLAV